MQKFFMLRSISFLFSYLQVSVFVERISRLFCWDEKASLRVHTFLYEKSRHKQKLQSVRTKTLICFIKFHNSFHSVTADGQTNITSCFHFVYILCASEKCVYIRVWADWNFLHAFSVFCLLLNFFLHDDVSRILLSDR